MDINITITVPDRDASTKEQANERIELIENLVMRGLRDLINEDPLYKVKIDKPNTSKLPPHRGGIK